MSYQARKKYAAFTILLNLVPGLGHLLAGRPAQALLWFVATLGGYSLYLLPGLFLHAWSTWSLVKYWHEEQARHVQYCEHCGDLVAEPEAASPPRLSKAA